MGAKINNIQALRAFAAVAVVFFHTDFALPVLGNFGAFGVEVFFVISGFIMARICQVSPDHFFARRVIRIVPPYWAMTLFLFVLALADPAAMGATRASLGELGKSLFFIPFYKANGLMRPLLFVGWSLNYEMFFYLAITLALWLWRRRPLLGTTLAIVATMLVARPLMGHGRAWADFYGDPVMLDFLAGMGVWELVRRTPPAWARRWRLVWAVGTTAAAAALVAEARFPQTLLPLWGEQALISVLAVLLVLLATLLSQAGWDTELEWVVLVGDASYVLYLIHPFLELSLGRVVAHWVPALSPARPVGCVVAVAGSVALAVAGHIWLERPVVKVLNRRFGGGRRSVEMSVPAVKAPAV